MSRIRKAASLAAITGLACTGALLALIVAAAASQ
jgi:hypothetical protein